ncbi:MAG TPA: ribonuclease H-like domain-containing protein [Myxococcaceae bacterium]|nr:ribonuclease H-like domain-containing protein [Myxococcaceae bacterium]
MEPEASSGVGTGGPLSATPPSNAPEAQRAREEKLRRHLAELGQRRRPVVSEEASAPKPLAQQVESPYGPLWMRESLLAEDHHHGRAPVRRVLELEAAWVADLALDPSLAGLPLEDLLLFDTETTGLAGGTGTLPFVVGLGWFEAGRLRLCQLLLERPGQEAPILRFLESRLAKASCLVTYNGKTFDWPLIRSRFVMNRLPPPKPRPHLDLLHCARRVFRHRPGGAKLVQIEREVLGFHRVGDIPGEEIPERYFRFLRTGRSELLEPVLTHNGHDLVLLAALLGALGQQYGVGHAEDPRDALGFASVAARAGQPDRALAFAEVTALRAPHASLQSQALALSAEVWKRGGRFDAAIEALQRALPLAPSGDRPQLHLMLSKLLEHRVGALEEALAHALHTAPVEGTEGRQRRIERLRRRLEAQAAASPRLEVVPTGSHRRRPA